METAAQLAIVLSAKDSMSAVLDAIGGKFKNLGVVSGDTAKNLDDLGSKAGSSVGKLQAVGALASGAIAVGIGVIATKSVEAAAGFQQMTTTLVTSAGESASQIDKVRQGILQIGDATGTSNEQLSKGMYQIESAGFHGADGLNILKAAAQGAKAENADLEKVSDAVTSTLRDYHLPASDAADVTSKLVTAVANGKSTFEGFTGALHSVLPVASAAHVSMNDVLGSLAAMTVHGMSADQAAQNLAHSINKMQSPTSAMTGELAQLGIKSSDLSDMLGTKGISGTLGVISNAITSKMGPSMKIMTDAFNGNKIQAEDAMKMFAAMPDSLQKVATAYTSGKMSLGDYRQELKSMPADQANLLQQFVQMSNKAHGFSDIMKSGKNPLQSYSQALQAATGDATTMNVALMTTGENGAYTANAVKAVGQAHAEAGGNVKGWGEIQKNLNQQLAEARVTISNMGISIGTALLPPLTAVVKAVMPVVSAIAGWISKNPQLAAGIMIAAGAIAAIVASILTLMLVATSISKLVEAFKAITLVTKIWQATTAAATVVMKLLNLAFLSSPIGWIVLAIGLLVVAFILLWNNCKPFREFWINLWKDIQAVFKVVVDFIVKAIENMVNWIKSHWLLLVTIFFGPLGLILGLVISHFGQIKDFIVNAITNVINWVKGHWQLLLAIFLGPLGIILGFVISHFTQIKTFISQAITNIMNVIKTVLGVIGTIFKYTFLIVLGLVILTFAAIYNAVKGPITMISNTIKMVFNAIFSFFKTIFGAIGSFFKAFWDREVAGWRVIFNTISTIVSTVFNAIYNFIKTIFTNIAAFFTLIWNREVAFWTAVFTTLYNIVSTVFTTVWNFIVVVFTNIFNFISNIWNRVYGFVNTILQLVWSIISSIFNRIYSTVSSILNSVFSVVSTVFTNVYNTVSSIINNVLKVIQDIVGKIKDVFANAGSWLIDAGKNIIGGLVNGIKGAAGDAVKAATGVAKDAISAAKQFLGIHSPSTVFQEIGDFTMQGFQQGIQKNAGKVTSATKDAAKGVVTTAKTTVAQQTAANPLIASTQPVAAPTSAQGNTNITITIKAGMYMGTTQEANEAATQIWQAMNRIANSHNLSFPQIGILPN